MNHSIEKCRFCTTVLKQCRCNGPHDVKWAVCRDCAMELANGAVLEDRSVDWKAQVATLRDQLAASDAACATLRTSLDLATRERDSLGEAEARRTAERDEARRERDALQSLLREAWPYVTECYYVGVDDDHGVVDSKAKAVHDRIYAALPTLGAALTGGSSGGKSGGK